jgi:IS30 family transposase
VHRIRARYGLSARVRPSTRYTDDEIARVESMLADGCSLAEVARTLGRNRQSVWRKFRGRGWTREQCAEWLRLTGGHLI